MIGLARALLFASASALSMAERYDDWQRAQRAALELDPAQRAQQMARVYEKDFGDVAQIDASNALSIEDLRLAYRASSSMTLLTDDVTRFRDSTHWFDELDQRGGLTAFEIETEYKQLVALRRFTAAKSFALRFPKQVFEKLPVVIDATNCCAGARPQLLSIFGPSRVVRSEAPPFEVVVVAHPLCHFTQEAIRAIEGDPTLSISATTWLWIAPQSGVLGLDTFEQWNREHPQSKMGIAFKQSQWPIPAIWETPTFYFFKNGAPAITIQGWPDDGQLRKLRDAVNTMQSPKR